MCNKQGNTTATRALAFSPHSPSESDDFPGPSPLTSSTTLLGVDGMLNPSEEISLIWIAKTLFKEAWIENDRTAVLLGGSVR